MTEIKKIHSFTIAGLKAENIETSMCSSVWERLFELYDKQTLHDLGNGCFYGVNIPAENPGKLHYLAGVPVQDISKAVELGMELIEVETMEYGILPLKGPAPDCLKKAWKYAWEVFFPKNRCQHAGTADYEHYPKGYQNDAAHDMELWLPIQRTGEEQQ